MHLRDHFGQPRRMEHPPGFDLLVTSGQSKIGFGIVQVQPPDIVDDVHRLLPKWRAVWITRARFSCRRINILTCEQEAWESFARLPTIRVRNDFDFGTNVGPDAARTRVARAGRHSGFSNSIAGHPSSLLDPNDYVIIGVVRPVQHNVCWSPSL